MHIGHYPDLIIEGYPVIGDGPLHDGKQPMLFLAAFPYLDSPEGKLDVAGRMAINATWYGDEDHPFAADYPYFRAYFDKNQSRTLNRFATDQGWTLAWENPTPRTFFLFVEVRNAQQFVLAQGQVVGPVFNVSGVGVDPHPEYPPAHSDEVPAIYYTGEWVAGASDLDDHVKVRQRIDPAELAQPNDGRVTLRLNWKRWAPDVTNPNRDLTVKKLVQQSWVEANQVKFQGDFVEITDHDFTAYGLVRLNT